MAKKVFDAAKCMKDIGAMVNTLTDRAESFQRYAVSEIANAVQNQLQERAPHDKDLPANYSKDLEVVRVEGRDASYAVVYRGKPEIASNLDPERTVLYINLLTTEGPEAELFAALKRFQPFTMMTMPLEVPREHGYVIAKRVTKAETTLVGKRTDRQKGAIQKVVDTVGKTVTSKAAFDKNSALIFNDLSFQVLRKELGIGLSRKPHWRPSIKFVASSGSFIKNLQTSPESKRLWNDPSFNGWVKLGILSENVSESSVSDLDDFQDKISKGLK